MNKIFLHIDIDAFFASVAELKNPEYKNKPVAVGSIKSRTGIISSANYIARNAGVKSAMPTFIAKQKCPELIIVSHSRDDYIYYSKKFIEIIKKFCTLINQVSIDECYVDLSYEVKKYHNNPRIAAAKIQREIKNKTGLNVSIGIANNKLLAKMATELAKPFGIKMIDKNYNLTTEIHSLSIHKVPFIGTKTAKNLENENIFTVNDFINEKNYEKAWSVVGTPFFNIFYSLKGNDEIKLFETTSIKSISRSTTLAIDTNDYYQLKAELKHLSSESFQEMKQNDLMTNNVGINIKYDNFTTKNKQQNIGFYTDDFDLILKIVILLFNQIYHDESVRLVGVSFNHLQKKEEIDQQTKLF